MLMYILWSEVCVIKWGRRLRVFIWIQSCIKLQKCLYPIIAVGTVSVHLKPHFLEFSSLYDYRLNLDRRDICLRFGSLKGKVAEKSVKVKVTQSCATPCDPMDCNLSVEFSMQKHWSGLPFLSPRDPPNPGIDPGLPLCKGILYHLSHQGSPEGRWRLPWLNRVTRVGEDVGTGGDNAAYPCSLCFISGSSQLMVLFINPSWTRAARQKTGRGGSHTEAELPVHPLPLQVGLHGRLDILGCEVPCPPTHSQSDFPDPPQLQNLTRTLHLISRAHSDSTSLIGLCISHQPVGLCTWKQSKGFFAKM